MGNYVLIESRDPFEYGDPEYMYHMAGDLAKKGNEVTLFLIQNGVLTTRPGIKDNPLAGLSKSSKAVKVLADEFSLRERGIKKDGIVSGVQVSDVDNLVDLVMQQGAKVVWH
ncbi:MAG: sulfur reduction protein DsrE [SAR202 cluster bacterium]|nr:sulfur reduction protein DsrE [SAR202 cluster bacterium]